MRDDPLYSARRMEEEQVRAGQKRETIPAKLRSHLLLLAPPSSRHERRLRIATSISHGVLSNAQHRLAPALATNGMSRRVCSP